MSSVLTVIAADGNPITQCDESCYAAKGKTCLCMCRGRNHGVGLTSAEAFAKERGRDLIAQYARNHADQNGHEGLVLGEPAAQERFDFAA